MHPTQRPPILVGGPRIVAVEQGDPHQKSEHRNAVSVTELFGNAVQELLHVREGIGLSDQERSVSTFRIHDPVLGSKAAAFAQLDHLQILDR